MKLKVGDKVIIKGTGATYSHKAFMPVLRFLNIKSDKCYDWSDNMSTDLKEAIKTEGVPATIVALLQNGVYIVKYENDMHSIISNEYKEIVAYEEINKGNIKYRIKDGITYVTFNKTTKGMAKVNPTDKCDNKKGILIATARALFDEEIVQGIVDVLYEESPKKLQDISTCEILCELERRIVENQNN